jgi:hypothetical protein
MKAEGYAVPRSLRGYMTLASASLKVFLAIEVPLVEPVISPVAVVSRVRAVLPANAAMAMAGGRSRPNDHLPEMLFMVA